MTMTTTTNMTISKKPWMATQGGGNDLRIPIDKHGWAFWSWAMELGGIYETDDNCIYLLNIHHLSSEIQHEPTL
jgi:hypothetical protein